MKKKLELIMQEITTLKTKITTKLQAKNKALLDTNKLLVESNRKQESLSKENTENDTVLTTLLKEIKELAQQLE